jgi:hypothetical protein
MSKLSRRSIVASAAALPALAVPAVALATSQPDDDAVLRHLWSEYLVHSAAYAAADKVYRPARAAFDADFPPCPDGVLPGHHWDNHNWLWNKHGLEPLWFAATAADDAMRNTVEKILETDATGLFGIGVKLAAFGNGGKFAELPSQYAVEDYEEAVDSVLSDINRLIGSDFVAPKSSCADDEAVQS